jgi:hypothetical protein
VELARKCDVDGAITAFEEALELVPGIDLDPEIETIETDPEAAAQQWAARAGAG